MAINLEELKPKKSTKPPRIVFYAVGGFGKTTFASQAPSPVFIQAEDGQGQLELAGKQVETYDDILEMISFLAEEEHGFKTVVLDTMDAVEKILDAKALQLHNELENKNYDGIEQVPHGKAYSRSLDLWNNIIQGLNYLRDTKDMMVIILGHSQIKSFSPPESEAYDRYKFNLRDKSSSLIAGWADIVLFGNYKIITKEVSEGRGKTLKATTKNNDRAIYTEERATHWGKNRYNLPYEIPFVQGEQWKAFEFYLQGGK